MAHKERCFIYAKDIMCITGRSKTYSYALLGKIKAYFRKEVHQMVTVEEYAVFHGIPVERVREFL